MEPTVEIAKTVQEIAKLVPPGDVITYVIIIGQFALIILLEFSFRKKDRLFSEIVYKLINEFNEVSKQIELIAGTIKFLALHKPTHGVKDEEKEKNE